MNNIITIINGLRGALQNPAQILQGMGLPADALRNPQAAVQQLMNSGRMTQQQFTSLQQTAQQIMQHPMFAQIKKP